MFKLHNLIIAVLAACVPLGSAHAEDFTPTRFSVEVQGEGPDVILIPGLGSSREVWTSTANHLDDTHRVHILQIAGFAGAPAGPNAEGAILVPVADEIAAYIHDNNIAAPTIVGHSLGGVVAMLLAEAHPDAVGKLAVVDALPFFAVLMDPNATEQSIVPGASAFRDGVLALDDATFRAQQTGGIARYVKTEAARPAVLNWSMTSDRGVFARAAYEVITTDLRPRIAAIQAPLLVLYAHDPVMGPPTLIDGLYAANYAAATGARLQRIDGSYHFIMIDQPGAFQTALAAFMDAH